MHSSEQQSLSNNNHCCRQRKKRRRKRKRRGQKRSRQQGTVAWEGSCTQASGRQKRRSTKERASTVTVVRAVQGSVRGGRVGGGGRERAAAKFPRDARQRRLPPGLVAMHAQVILKATGGACGGRVRPPRVVHLPAEKGGHAGARTHGTRGRAVANRARGE